MSADQRMAGKTRARVKRPRKTITAVAVTAGTAPYTNQEVEIIARATATRESQKLRNAKGSNNSKPYTDANVRNKVSTVKAKLRVAEIQNVCLQSSHEDLPAASWPKLRPMQYAVTN